MKKSVLIFVLALCSWSLFGQGRTTVSVTEANIDCVKPSINVLTVPVIADISVAKEKVTYVERDAFKGFTLSPAILEQLPTLKNIAVANAISLYNADLFIGINISVSTSAEGFLEITVIGYPATYSNFRNATADEVRTAYTASLVTADKDVDPLQTDTTPTKIVKR